MNARYFGMKSQIGTMQTNSIYFHVWNVCNWEFIEYSAKKTVPLSTPNIQFYPIHQFNVAYSAIPHEYLHSLYSTDK